MRDLNRLLNLLTGKDDYLWFKMMKHEEIIALCVKIVKKKKKKKKYCGKMRSILIYSLRVIYLPLSFIRLILK
jgi:hypothetical protein